VIGRHDGGPDAGIDLVAQTIDGKLWAIQAKVYASEYWVKKSDVDTFLSESARATSAVCSASHSSNRSADSDRSLGGTGRRRAVSEWLDPRA
jgi:predicted helicase